MAQEKVRRKIGLIRRLKAKNKERKDVKQKSKEKERQKEESERDKMGKYIKTRSFVWQSF